MEGASFSEESGPFDFQTFLIGMNKLFEKFVTQVLRERARSRFTADDQVSIHLGYEQNVPMRPDMIVSEGGRLGFVVDCKYKRLESGEFKDHDVYQMLAYCTALGVQQGLLIYPVHTAEVQDVVAIRSSDAVIRQATIDLGKEEIEELNQKCETLAQLVLGWLHPLVA